MWIRARLLGRGDLEAAALAGSRRGAHDDFDIAPERREEFHQPLRGEAAQTPMQDVRDLRLIDAHQRGGRELGKSAFPDDIIEHHRELRLGQLFGWMLKTEIRVDIATAAGDWDLRDRFSLRHDYLPPSW